MSRVLSVMELGKVYRMSDRDYNRVVRDVRVPAAHEGVGNALRGAYDDASQALPPEMARLLDLLA